MAFSSDFSEQFKLLSPEAQQAILADIGNTGNAMPTLNFAKDSKLKFPVAGTVFKDDAPNYTGETGPLTKSDVAGLLGSSPDTSNADTPVEPGPLSRTAPSMPQRKPIDVQAMIQQFMPQDNSERSRYLALAAGFGAPTKSGTFGETMSNVANALNEQKAAQDKLRAQYVPLIMQQVAAQQAREEQAAYRMEAQQQAQAAAQRAQEERLAAQAENARLQRESAQTVAAGNQGLRADANNNARAQMIVKAMEQYPFGVPPAVMAQINAAAPSAGAPQPQQPQPMPGGPAPSAQAPGAAPNGAAILGPGSASDGLSGDAFLGAIPKPMADQVKALAEGRMQFPNGLSAKSPYWQGMIQAVSQYDPDFDATNYNKRYQTAAAFSKGKQGDAVRAVNQTISHMGSLSDAIDQLNNPGGLLTPVNGIVNWAQENTGDSRQGVFKQRVQAVSSELRKVFSGSGGGSLAELEAWEKSMPLNASKDQQKAYLQSAVDLLGGAMGALDQQYKQGMGTNADLMNSGLISEKAQKTLGRIRGFIGSTTQPDAATSKPDYAAQAIAELQRRQQGAQ